MYFSMTCCRVINSHKFLIIFQQSPDYVLNFVNFAKKNDMRIHKEQTIGVFIDFQERLYPFINKNEELTRNTSILIQGLRVLNVPIIVTEQYTKGLGKTIEPLRHLLEGEKFIEKQAFSCCDEPLFSESLALTYKRYVIIAGIETHVCVLQTVIDLLETGYKPVVIENCISSRKPEDKHTAIERMKKEGAIISSYESILFELLRFSGTDQFKAISKLVK